MLLALPLAPWADAPSAAAPPTHTPRLQTQDDSRYDPESIQIDDDPDLHIPSPIFSKAKLATAFSMHAAGQGENDLVMAQQGEPGAFWKVRTQASRARTG